MREPFGKPGFTPNWSRASKEGIGTACCYASKVWFTIADGVITEVFYPSVDVANTKDIQFLITDGKTFFNEEKSDTAHLIEYIDPSALAYRVTNTAKDGRYRIIKNIVTDPSTHSLVVRASFEVLKDTASPLRLFILFAPHIKNMGWANSGRILSYLGRDYLVAWRDEVAAALSSDVGFKKASAGYSGSSDGWQDLKDNLSMDWAFGEALEGNIALMAEIDIPEKKEFTLALSFGGSETEAVTEGRRALKREYRVIEKEYIKGWKKYLSGLKNLSRSSADGGRLFRISAMVLKAHEDKTTSGVTASLSIPWGDIKGDGESGGYHLIWARDMVNAAFAFMAMGDAETPVKILGFLSRTQRADGSWPQNMWLDGRPYWHMVQLDEVAFPVMLAWRLKKMGVIGDDFYLMAKKAAAFLAREGPISEQDRWEENSGFSPFTLGAEVAALVCAAHWARQMGDITESRYLFETADYWASRIEDWTFTSCDCLSGDDPGHFLRVVKNPREELSHDDELCHAEVFLKNAPSGSAHPQGQIIDAGFLALPRYGLRKPDDTHIVKSLTLVDGMLKKDMPYGPLFYRYNGDGYGEKPDGSPFDGSGVGRLWPLLAGERGVYEAMAGQDPAPYIKAMEGAANAGLMLPEQVWDAPDIPERGLFRGKGTGAATPLMWAHAEYIKLLRTRKDGKGCDVIDEVFERYAGKIVEAKMTAWKRNKPIRWALSSDALRIVSHEAGLLVWSVDGWATRSENALRPTGLGLFYHDFRPGALKPQTKLIFTFLYEGGRWEGRDYEINMQ